MRSTLVIILTLFCNIAIIAQTQPPCTTLGQTPSTAFPVCGTTAFNQVTVPICENRAVPVPGCTSPNDPVYTDKNPFWYRFTCYQSGTLGFVITPNDLGDDYDWQIFDITGRNADEVYTNASLFVVGNWSGSYGLTGASAAGQNNIQCASAPNGGVPTFSRMPTLQQGHTYLLLVSHYTDSQSGYSLSFGGGTAVITDPTLPGMQNAKTTCDGTQITLKLNKKMKCSSLAANGSDFSIAPAVANVTGATGIGCSNGFELDSVTLTLSAALPSGNYDLVIKNGADGNTLLDNCDRNITPGSTAPFTVLAATPTPMDSLTAVQCAPQSLQLVFKKFIRCNSVAANGSDFIVTGPTPVTVVNAAVTCNNGFTDVITVNLSAPVANQGNYQIRLVRGSDGNTILDECGLETPVGSTLPFTVKDTVSAAFTYQLTPGCKLDIISFFHDGRNGVNQWLWNFDNSSSVTVQNPSVVYSVFGNKNISLIVSNGFCSDTATASVFLASKLNASFETNNLLCPEDTAKFIDKSTGGVTRWNWDFGNGITSSLQIPLPQLYPKDVVERDYNVRLIVESDAGCLDTAFSNIKVLKTCLIAVPNAFTPNGDGLNDYLYPLNAYKAANLDFRIYNRYGQLVFKTNDWTRKWDGTINGLLQGPGTYVWHLSYSNADNGKKFFLKGTSTLIR
ncbi:MAG: gliding motility-associated C-terminal domain-containing protein [Chitinophagaceae bacterium]|nr:gliding motility-associated C-terminal domain-containing protein [Chitinophagaceae bacterium]